MSNLNWLTDFVIQNRKQAKQYFESNQITIGEYDAVESILEQIEKQVAFRSQTVFNKIKAFFKRK